MAETLSDSPLSVTAGTGRSPLSPASNHKRNNRHRKQRQQLAVQSDGIVSESGLNVATSPRVKKTDKPRQNLTPGAFLGQPAQTVGNSPTTKSRPIPLNSPGAESPFKEQAYAGPTFQSSPAASALPMPKFFSKSAPNGAGKVSLQGILAGEKSPEQQASSPEADVVKPAVPPRDTQQSPLDVFFNADRAERERLNNASQGGNRSPLAGQRSQTNRTRNIPYDTPARSGRSAFLSELSGEQHQQQTDDSVDPVSQSPASPKNFPVPNVQIPSGNSDDERRAYTQSLKSLLFDATAQQASTPPRQSSNRNSQTPESVYFTPPAQYSSSVPTTPQNHSSQPNQHALHYGNRNLSPLFKAARSDPPSRPSSLRQEMSYDGASATDSAIDVNSPRPPPMQRPIPYQHHQLPYQQQTEMGLRSLPSNYPPQQPRNSTPTKTSHVSSGTNDAWTSSQPPVSPRTAGPHDLRTMEDDLRRMLKLNVLN